MILPPSRLTRGARLVMAVLLVISFATVVFLALQVRTELRNLQEEPLDSLQWNVTQLELDVVRLEVAATIANLTPGSDLADLRRRYDLLFNRASTVTEGAMFVRLGLTETVAPLKARLKAFLDTTTPLIDGPDDQLRAELPQLVPAIDALRQDVRSLSIRVIEAHAAQQDAQRTELSDILRMIALASVLLILLLLALLGVLLGLNRQADRRTREVQRISSRLEATVGTALDAVIVAGMDGRVIDFNAAAERIFGYSRAEAVGNSLATLIVPPRHRAAHDAGMTRMRTTGVKHVVDAGRIEITAVRRSGEEFPVELSIASNDGPDGMIFIAYLRDISEAKKAAAALVTARDEAQAAERTKTNFIAVMSHEMRTPLNGVIGALDIIGRTRLDDRQSRFLDLARGSANQLLRHVNDVLDISRIDAGFMAVAEDRFDLPALIATLIDPLRPAAAKKDTRLEVALLSDIPPLRGDPFRLGQILQNFVMNAIKFTEGGQITIEAEVHRIAGDQADVEIRVIDTGIGIAEADQERIFQDFVMVDPSYGRSGEGTGLGLAISRRLARAMAGEVGVESEPGEGSCFWLRLPLTVAGPASEAPPARPVPQKALDTGVLDVLVVEDNETNRIVMDEMLRHLGHRVTLAVDGREGVNAAQSRRYDVILMDLSMPQMDGWAAAAAIRAAGESRSSRIVAVTAHVRQGGEERLKDSGFDSWLTKPLSVRALAAALEPQASDTPASVAEGTDIAPVLDAERMAELQRISDRAAMQRLLTGFQDQMERILLAIRSGAAAHPAETLAALCHEGAGAAAVIGAARLHRQLAAMEAQCRVADRAALDSSLDAVEGIWQATRAALQDVAPGTRD